jgi:hypothetical protein
LKSEFVVAPGADPARIQIAYAGVAGIRVDEEGGLVFSAPDGELHEAAPEIYQESNGRRDPVKGAFRVSGDVVSFYVGEYDHSRELRIDPVLTYSTYLGGSGTNKGTAIAVDSANAAYITGYTDSTNFPVVGAEQSTSLGSVEVFVTKLNASGNAIVYSTYLGGSGDARGYSIAVDGTGNAYVTGSTGSTNFPLVAAGQGSSGGGRDAFVAKLNAAGSTLLFSTYLGGTGTDSGNGIAIDASGVYVAGSTTSVNFPVSGAFQSTLAGGQDGFVTKLSPIGSALIYSTYLGGSFDDRVSSIAVDSTGAVYVTGNTNSTNFPTASPAQSANAGAPDAFVTKLNASGSALIYSTYLGGSGVENVEVGRSIALDSSNSAYITGTTSSTNFPTFQPMQGSLSGSNDAFVVKMSPSGSSYVYSTYLGGSGIDYGESIAVDSSGNAYIAGYTSSSDFPILNGDQPAIGGGYDAFLVKLNGQGSGLAGSDFLGGSGSDAAYGIALDSSGNAYLTGQTSSFNFPLITPVQSTLGTSTLAAFVAKFGFGPGGPPVAVSVTPASGSGASQLFSLVFSDSRGFSDINWTEMNWNATQSAGGGCYVHFTFATNSIMLANDAGLGWVGSAILGTAGTLQNSQCIVDASASSASGSANNLTLNLAITFKQAFAGAKNVYMQLMDDSATLAPWQARGTWTATVTSPSSVSVTPASGTGVSQLFSFAYTDPYGYADINWVAMHFQTQLVAANACFIVYTRATNTVQLVSDSGGNYAGSATVGASGQLSNSQCTINTGSSSATQSGNNLTVNLALTFIGTFAGTKNISMAAVNNAGAFGGWQTLGTWTVPSSGSLPPVDVSVTPSSGTGSNQTLTFVYSDPYGYGDINWVAMHFQTQVVSQNACFIEYTRASNVLTLVNDSGGGNVGTATLGVPGTLNNSQCTLDAGASSVSASGNTLTVSLALVFKPGFAGTKNINMAVVNNAGFFPGWQANGTWTVPNTGLPPANVSVTPSSGAGSSAIFSFVYTDPNGPADINQTVMHFQTQLVVQNACFLWYTRSTNTVQLMNDAGTAFVGSGVMGTAGTQSNSQCTIDTGASSSSVSGTNLYVNVALTFIKPVFNGAKNISMGVFNNAGTYSGWQTKGTWTVQ